MLVTNPFLCLESHFCGKKYKSVRWGKPGLWKKFGLAYTKMGQICKYCYVFPIFSVKILFKIT